MNRLIIPCLLLALIFASIPWWPKEDSEMSQVDRGSPFSDNLYVLDTWDVSGDVYAAHDVRVHGDLTVEGSLTVGGVIRRSEPLPLMWLPDVLALEGEVRSR